MPLKIRLCRIGYIADMEDAQRRMKRGEKQRLCKKCLRWVWADHRCRRAA